MKILFGMVAIVLYLGAAELIYVSDIVDDDNLNKLYIKYKKEIVVNDNRAYIVPSDCLLVRHFGGLSQSRVETVGKELQNGYLSMTQEVFEARDASSIKQEIQKQKISDIIEAKAAKAFLDESDGHLFGGLSQGSVNLQEQKKPPQTSPRMNSKEEKKITHPTCKLLENGLGYMLFDTKDAKIYNGSGLEILQERVLFR